MAIPARVIQDLPRLNWRGLGAQCEDATFSFSHSQVERGAYGIDAAWHDHARRDPIKFKCKLHFINTLISAPKEFPENYNKWQEALLDGSTGKLRHPILGTIDARVENGDVRLVAQVTAGVTIEVNFTETRVDVTKPTEFSSPDVDVKALAAQIGHDARRFNIAYPSGILDRTLEDAIGSILGNVHAAQITVAGYASQVVGKVSNMIEAVERVTDPAAAPLYTNLVTLWDALRTRAKEVEKLAARGTSKQRVAAPTTIDAFAKTVGNTEDEIMYLNPALIAKPSVPAGTVVAYYTGK